MSDDPHRFADSLARLIEAGEHRAAELDARADDLAELHRYELRAGHVDRVRDPERPTRMRVEANQLRNDARRWRSVREAAERFAEDIRTLRAATSPTPFPLRAGPGIEPPTQGES